MDKPMQQLRRSKRLQVKQNNLIIDEYRTQTQHQIQQHPLLNELVLENIFTYLKGKNNANTLANYRCVCKIWDREIYKLMRKDTEINLLKILAPYPAGMGWTASPGNLEELYRYEAPYPDIRPFENVVMTADSCEYLGNQKCVDWFKNMGSDVKGLCFSSPLTCICQNAFLERILKEWCPSLERLELTHVKCVESLTFNSFFLKNSTSFICLGFKDLLISVNGFQRYTPCGEEEYTISSHEAFIKVLAMTLENFHLVWLVNKYRNLGNNAPFPEIVNLAGELVEFPDYLSERVSIGCRNYFSEIITGTDEE